MRAGHIGRSAASPPAPSAPSPLRQDGAQARPGVGGTFPGTLGLPLSLAKGTRDQGGTLDRAREQEGSSENQQPDNSAASNKAMPSIGLQAADRQKSTDQSALLAEPVHMCGLQAYGRDQGARKLNQALKPIF